MQRFWIMGIALMLAVLTGCTTVKELPKQTLAEEPDGAEHRLCRELLIHFIKNDPDGFENLLPEDTRKNFDRAQFVTARKNVIRELGEPVSFEYVTSLEFPAITPHIWKIRFRREMKDGKDLYRETLFRILTGTSPNGEVLVIGFNFL